MQFSIEQHEINYVRNYTKSVVYDIIKIRIRIDNENFYSILYKFLKIFYKSFDKSDRIQKSKTHIKLFDSKFRIKKIRIFRIFYRSFYNDYC